MFKIIKTISHKGLQLNNTIRKQSYRLFLSEAYYCKEVWDNRLDHALFKKVNLDELYYELDQRFQRTRQMSAIDVDIFANVVTDESFRDELLDVIHKLRLTADTGNTLNSTSHAVIRAFLDFNKAKDLLAPLDDRLNYGIFLSHYTANILLDTFWRLKDYASGARVASQLMLQEDFTHPLSSALSLLHCFNYLRKPEGWPELPKPEEPEEEVKVRVKYIRNPYDDEHFDLRDPTKIVGKTLVMITKGKEDSMSKSLNILGLVLFEKNDDAKKSVEDCLKKNIRVYTEVMDLVPVDSKTRKDLATLKSDSDVVQFLLIKNVEEAYQKMSEKDIANQCELYGKWENERLLALEDQKKRLETARRLSEIEQLQETLKDKETKLWYFNNKEKIELEIEEKSALLLSKQEKIKEAVTKSDEDYIPPEIIPKKLG